MRFTVADEVVTLAAQYNIPTMYSGSAFAQAGGLISYGIDFGATLRQDGIYIGRILNGEKAADLPVVQPTKFQFVINLNQCAWPYHSGDAAGPPN
jgi:putative ABC transport system substrate-binding protein